MAALEGWPDVGPGMPDLNPGGSTDEEGDVFTKPADFGYDKWGSF